MQKVIIKKLLNAIFALSFMAYLHYYDSQSSENVKPKLMNSNNQLAKSTTKLQIKKVSIRFKESSYE